MISLKPSLSWLNRHFGQLLIFAVIISALVTYGVISGSQAPLGLKPRRVVTLLGVNIALLSVLIVLIGMRTYTLWRSLRSGSAGSRLQKRIVVLFSIVTIVPTLLVSVFSAFFFNLGIQAWFNDRVQKAVEESLAVAEAYVEEHKENIRGDALAMAGDLGRVANLAYSDPPEFARIVSGQAAMRVLTEAIVVQRGRVLAQGALSFGLAFERIPQNVLDRAASGEAVLMTTEDDKVRALVRIDGLDDGFLMVGRLVDSKVLNHMESAQGAVHEYDTLKSQLGRLQTAFSIVFVTVALLLLLAAIWYGMVFASRLSKPISNLLVATERVRGGDFGARVAIAGTRDEIGTLSRGFNRMTEQLEAQRTELIEANRRLDERRRFSEAVLSGVSAGVIALGPDKRITLSNRSAAAILSKIDQAIEVGDAAQDLLPGLGELLEQAEKLPGETAQNTLTLDKGGKALTLHARVAVERSDEEIQGFIVTFDDITLLIAAQRNAAWGDVARRVAHEIKNPLTPIQLAAERLKRKYLKYITEDQETFIKYTDTIARHVGDIGRMVEEFVSFARMPTPRFADEDLKAILRKAVFTARVAKPGVAYTLAMPAEDVCLHCDERQITQVMTNLLKNAGESIETRLGEHEQGPPGVVRVALEAGERIRLTVEDNGTGFPPEMHKLLEPYVTTRSKGTGLGLAIVKKIIEDHKGTIELANIPEGGARVSLSFPPHCDINAASDGTASL